MNKPILNYAELIGGAPPSPCGHLRFDLDCQDCWRLNLYLGDFGFDTWDDPAKWTVAWNAIKGTGRVPGLRAVAVSEATKEEKTAINEWYAEWRRLTTVLCHWCRHSFSPKGCHKDHVVPLARGGAHALRNLVIACASCNLRKHDRMPEEWVAEMGRG